MYLDLKNLPAEKELLRQIIIDLSRENDSLISQLKLLKAKYYGKTSERIDRKQLARQIEELEGRVEASELDTPKQIK